MQFSKEWPHNARPAASAFKLSLRDLFWLMLLAAIGVGWGVERYRAIGELLKIPQSPWSSRATSVATRREELNRATYTGLFPTLSEAQLISRFRNHSPNGRLSINDEYHCCLSELVRRGHVTEIQRAYDQVLVEQSNRVEGPDNSLLLTALRRAQGNRDPFKIHVEIVEKDDNGDPYPVPQVRARIENVDVEQVPCLLRRSGREDDWRIHLTDVDGKRSNDRQSGGFWLYDLHKHDSGLPLVFGEMSGWDSLYDPRSYFAPPPSGRYQLEVVYCHHEIARDPDLTGLIVWKSDPIWVEVDNRMERAKYQISALPLLGAVLVAGFVWGAVRWLRKKPPAWREWFPPVLVVLLLCGWVVDLYRLRSEIERSTPDSHADWSLRPVEGPAAE